MERKMSTKVELWMHPQAGQALAALRHHAGMRSKARRSLAFFDELVAQRRVESDAISAIAALRPAPVAVEEYTGAGVRGNWPQTEEGHDLRDRCHSVTLCVYELHEISTVISIVDARTESYVVALSVLLVADVDTQEAGISNVVLARQRLGRDLALLFDLSWLESV